LDKGELLKAEQEYNIAVTTAAHPDPTYYYRLADALRLDGKIDDALAALTKCSELSQGVLKQYADQQIDRLKKDRAGSGAPKP
jgi:hypothetical protein